MNWNMVSSRYFSRSSSDLVRQKRFYFDYGNTSTFIFKRQAVLYMDALIV